MDLYLLLGYMDTDLYKFLKRNTINEDNLRYITFQVVQGLNVLHQSKIIHRDIKPTNILIDDKYSIKLCDFGFARTLLDQNH